MRILIAIIILCGIGFAACDNENKRDPKSEVAAKQHVKRIRLYDEYVSHRDTVNTASGMVKYSEYDVFQDYKCPPYNTRFHCYEFADTALTCFSLNVSFSGHGDWISLVFINTQSKFRILSIPDSLPRDLTNGLNFGGLMTYISEMEHKLPEGRFESQIINSSQEFSGWQYEFEKKTEEDGSEIILSDKDELYCEIRVPHHRVSLPPPFLFTKFSYFVDFGLPSLSEWCWDEY